MLLIKILFTALALWAIDVSAFIGSSACQGCHAEEHAQWRGSHHDLAMQLPSSETVLGNFNNASFTYNNVTTRFFRDGEKFIVNTDGEDGKTQDFEVSYVFGVSPLQQVTQEPMQLNFRRLMSTIW